MKSVFKNLLIILALSSVVLQTQAGFNATRPTGTQDCPEVVKRLAVAREV
jgi:hypothetical protein